MDHTQPPRRPRPRPQHVPPTNGHPVPHAHTPYSAPQGYVGQAADPYRAAQHPDPYAGGPLDTYANAFPDPYASAYSDPYNDPYDDDDYDDEVAQPYPQDRIPAQRRAHETVAGSRRPAPRRRSTWPIAVVCVLLVALLVLGGVITLIGA